MDRGEMELSCAMRDLFMYSLLYELYEYQLNPDETACIPANHKANIQYAPHAGYARELIIL